MRPTLIIGLLSLCAFTACEASVTPEDLGPRLYTENAQVEPNVGSVGVLFVVDSSSSMGDRQQLLLDELVEHADELSTYDLTVSAISTDSEYARLSVAPGRTRSTGCVSAPDLSVCPSDPEIDSSDPEFSELLACAMLPGDCGGQFERGLSQMLAGLRQATETVDKDALLIVFLTDEDDCSGEGTFRANSESDCYVAETRDSLLPVQDVVDAVRALRGDDGFESTWVLTVIGPQDGRDVPTRQQFDQAGGASVSCASTESALLDFVGYDGRRYREFCSAFPDRCVESSICEADALGDLPNTLTQMTASGIRPYICLDPVPVGACEFDSACPGSRCVRTDGVTIGMCANTEISARLGGTAGQNQYALTPENPTDDGVSLVFDHPSCDGGFAVATSREVLGTATEFSATWLGAAP